MSIRTGRHRLGPENATLQVRTYREGIASKVGHDLVIDVTGWEATVSVGDDWARSTVELTADPQSLHVREGLHGVKPLTDRDRAEIRQNIERKVLGREPIRFRSTALELGESDRLSGHGELQMAGAIRPIRFELRLGADGALDGTLPLTQSHWGIKPYRGLMGALRVRDALDVVIEARLPVG